MIRTKHHRNQKHQHIGEDFWSRRAGMDHYQYNTYGKRLTIRKERNQVRRIIINETISRNNTEKI